MSVRLGSDSASSSTLAALVDAEPDGQGDMGEPKSARVPANIINADSFVVFHSQIDSERPVSEHLEAITPVLQHLATVPRDGRPQDLKTDVLISVGKVRGAVSMTAEFVDLAAATGARIVIFVGTMGE